MTIVNSDAAGCRAILSGRQGHDGNAAAVVAAFRRFDCNGDGTIVSSELKTILRELDPETWSDKAISLLLKGVDADQNGCIDVDEFLCFVFQNELGGAAVKTVFDPVPHELRLSLFQAAARRMNLFEHPDESGITMQGIARLRLLGTPEFGAPPPVCISIMSAMCWLLFGQTLDLDEACKSFESLCFSDPRNFMQKLLDPPWLLSADVLDKVEALMAEPDFTREAVAKVADDPFPGLTEWVSAVMEVHRALRKFGSVPINSDAEFSESTVYEVVSQAATPAGSYREQLLSSPLREQSPVASAAGSVSPVPVEQITVVTTAAAAPRPWAALISQIRRKDLVELKALKHPPVLVRVVLAAVCWLLTGEGHSDSHMSWRMAQRMIGNTSKFLHSLMNPPEPTIVAIENAARIVQETNDFTAEGASKVSACLSALTQWILAVLSVQKQAGELEHELKSNRATLATHASRVVEPT